MRIPTPIIDLALVVTPYIIGFAEKKLTGSSLILDAIDKLSFGEKSILYILTFLLVEIISYKFSYNEFVDKTIKELDKTNVELNFIKAKLVSLKSKVELIDFGGEMDKSLNYIKHPYFVNLITKRFKQLMSNNSEIFKQTEYTSPSHVDTFGAKGIKTTRETLRCVSFIPEYWEDKKDTEYMDIQGNLIKRGVKIQRLFIVNDKNRENSLEQMRVQNLMGIETKAIEQSMVDNSFREKDFLLQDDELLVDLYFEEEDASGRHVDAKELVTMDEIKVLESKEEFLTNWASARAL